jgi:hypothetical protein
MGGCVLAAAGVPSTSESPQCALLSLEIISKLSPLVIVNQAVDEAFLAVKHVREKRNKPCILLVKDGRFRHFHHKEARSRLRARVQRALAGSDRCAVGSALPAGPHNRVWQRAGAPALRVVARVARTRGFIFLSSECSAPTSTRNEPHTTPSSSVDSSLAMSLFH